MTVKQYIDVGKYSNC